MPSLAARLVLLGALVPGAIAPGLRAEPGPVQAAEAVVGVEAGSTPQSRPPDIVFITVDTLRRDHVSAYGHERLTTPAIDELARQGALFTDCQAVIPVTGPGHASLFSGLYPHTHGAFRNGVRIDPAPVLLGDLLRERGYRSHATVAGWTLKDAQCGLARGFDSYDEELDQRVNVVTHVRRAEAVTDAALAWLDGAPAEPGPRAPLFLFVHYFDPHEPYDAPLAAVPGPNPAADGGPDLVRYRTHLEDYDREIAYADREIGRLLAGLEARGLSEDAIVVFTADHGQAFGEHDEGGPEGKHGRKAYQSTLAAPLVIRAPGRVAAGRRIDLPVSHLDLLPTLASLAGVAARDRPPALQGHDLSEILVDPEAPPPWGGARRLRYGVAFRGAVGNKWNLLRFLQNRAIDDATPLQYVVLDGNHSVLVRPRKPQRFEVYDLARDPGQRRPLTGRARDRFRGHVAKLEGWYRRTQGELDTSPLTEEQLEGLAALGYVGN